MTTTLDTRVTDRPVGGDPTPSVASLRRMADELGQLDVGDLRLDARVDDIDRCLRAAATRSDDPRARTWLAVADNPSAPLVVKLRALGAALSSFR